MFARILALSIGIVAFGGAQANDIFGRPTYGPLGLTKGVGYKDHPRKDGTWSIAASSTSGQRAGYAGEMALYRAAEVASREHHPYFQLLRSEALIGTGMRNLGIETVSLIVRFADTDAPPPDCLQRGRHPGTCDTVDARRILARLEPLIRDASWRPDRPARQSRASGTDRSGPARWSTLFRFDVNEQGGIARCNLVETDAPDELNVEACRTFTATTHFKPVVDGAGKAIRSTRTARVVWQRSDVGSPTTEIHYSDAQASGI